MLTKKKIQASSQESNIFVLPKREDGNKRKPSSKNSIQHKVIVKDKQFSSAIEGYNNACQQINHFNTLKTDYQSVILTNGKKNYLEIYRKQKSNPNSIIFDTEKDNAVLYVPQDKYVKIDEDDAIDLDEKYDNITERTTTYTLDSVLVEKYKDVLSKLIMNSKDISQDDKKNLIKVEQAFSIKKGAIDKLNVHNKNMEQLFDDLGIVVQIKTTKCT